MIKPPEITIPCWKSYDQNLPLVTFLDLLVAVSFIGVGVLQKDSILSQEFALLNKTIIEFKSKLATNNIKKKKKMFLYHSTKKN